MEWKMRLSFYDSYTGRSMIPTMYLYMPSMASRAGRSESFNHASTISWQRLIQLLFPRKFQNNCDAAQLTTFSEMHGIPCSFSVSFNSNKFNANLSLIFKFQSQHHHHHGHQEQEHHRYWCHWCLLFVIYLLLCAALIHSLTHSQPLSNNLHHEKQYQGKTVLFPFPHRRHTLTQTKIDNRFLNQFIYPT